VTWQTPVAQRIYRDELERLGRFLIGLGGHAPRPEELAALISEYSRARNQLLEAAAWCPARPYAEAVARFHLDGSVSLPSDRGCPPPQLAPQQSESGASRLTAHASADASPWRADSIPLALVGGPLPQSQMSVLDAIEKAGGRVALNATEAGERSLWPPCPPDQSQPDSAALLAASWLANCVDVFQRPNTRLYDWLRPRLIARKAHGIVLWHYVGCDLWRAEAQPLREAFGLPVLLLDADETASQRNTGRLQAFLESLQ
jgi:hypothetical protein